MTARMTARLTTSFLLSAIAFLVYLLLVAAPASAHHREDHTNGKPASTEADVTTPTSTDGSETSGTDGGSTATGSESASTRADSSTGATSDTKNSNSSSASADSGNPGSTEKHEEKAATGTQKHGFDPDPVHQPTAPATKGPTTCPDYNDGDAGPYDHENCDGTQGLHGNGGNGKCAGCTGKADDKWPGGQNVGDHNNGYECDHNGGIGKGNPAHSRCATPPPPPCVDNPQTPHDECNPPTPCVDNPTTPMDECNPPPPPCVDNPDTPKDECNPPPPKPPEDDDDVEGLVVPNIEEPEDRQATRGRPTLPFTGATVGNFLWLALLLMGAGMFLLWRVRDRGADA